MIAKLPATKAVDFVGLHNHANKSSVWLIEVTDYATDPRRLDDQVENQGLAQEFAMKVRDTLAGVLLLNRCSDKPIWRDICRAVSDRGIQLRVVLWVCKCRGSKQKHKQQVHTLNQQLKKLFRFRPPQMFAFVDLEESRIQGLATTETAAASAPQSDD